MPRGPAFAAEFGEVGGVCVDGKNHVAGMVADAGNHQNVRPFYVFDSDRLPAQ